MRSNLEEKTAEVSSLTQSADSQPVVTPPIGIALQNKEGPNGPFPPELKGWNWGAFFFTTVWGVANNVHISLVALLGFVPIIGPIIGTLVSVVLGIKGNELAWKSRKYANIQEFKAVQGVWSRWAIILMVAFLLIMLIAGHYLLAKLHEVYNFNSPDELMNIFSGDF